MPFDQKVEDHHKLSFQSNFEMVTQRTGSKLRQYVSEKPCEGEGAVAADLIGEVQYMRGGARDRRNPENVPDRKRRWLTPQDPLETGQYLDKIDKFRMIDDPTSKLYEAHGTAMRRGVDDIILGLDQQGNVATGGIFGTVVEGKRPSNTVSLGAERYTDADGNGLTIAKLRAARLQLGLDENDLEFITPVMAISTYEHDDLLGIVEQASSNLNMLEQPHIVEGKVKRLMGFNFVEINRLPLDDAGARMCPVWLKNQICLGVWQDLQTNMWNDTSMKNIPYVFIDGYFDCTRIEDLGVHIVKTVRP